MVRTGLDAIASDSFASLAGCRLGLLANHTSVDRSLRHIIDLLSAAPGIALARVFTPEHGLFAHAQDQIPVEDGTKQDGPPLVSLYGKDEASLWPDPALLSDLDVLLVDIQDIGSRYYTYATTMGFCLERAAEIGLRVVVLDRPNPIGGHRLEGPMLREEMRSFVGWYPLPVRHGLTLGEFACFVALHRELGLDLEIIPMHGWRRSMHYARTGLPWVLPSPNMPTLETALVYPGGCLLEGTNWSEGRGTTRPFELFGSPTLDAVELKRRMDAEALPGVAFRVHEFQPTFHKYAGQVCRGLQIYITDWNCCRIWLTYALILAHGRRLDPAFDWRREPYEFVHDRLAIDLLFGNGAVRQALEAGECREALEVFEREGEEEFMPLFAELASYSD